MILAASLVLLLAGAPLLPPVAPGATVTAVPDTPGATMLPEAVTYEAIVADVDRDGAGDLVRLVDAGDGAIKLEAWSVDGQGVPHRIFEALTVAPSQQATLPGELVYAGSPSLLVARRVDGAVRATLVRQPRFEEPGLEVDCCLFFHDVVASDGALRLVAVADEGHVADAVLAIDLDGDATDELLLTRSLPPLGQTTFPTEARVLRWTGVRFGAPTVTEVDVGSGFSPFVLGDSDGVPGDEAAFIAAQSRLHRLSLRADDALAAESADSGISSALAVPIDGGRGIATVSFADATTVRPWPRDEEPGEAIGALPIYAGSIVGVAHLDDGPRMAIQRPDGPPPALITLPELLGIAPASDDPVVVALAHSPAPAYVGPVPGGGPDGEGALALAGTLAVNGGLAPSGPLASVRPVGFLGPDNAWMGLWHGDWLGPTPGPGSSVIRPPSAPAGSGISIVAVEAITMSQGGDAILEPAVSDAAIEGDRLLVGSDGFVATVAAPRGSRVYITDDLGRGRQVDIVPASGELAVRVHVPEEPGPGGPGMELAVVTPAGHGYVAAWSLRVLGEVPELSAQAATPLGSARVAISGTTAPGASVRVAGRQVSVEPDGRFRTEVEFPPWPTTVEVVAIDQLGHAAEVDVVGVGWYDYRGLPWIAIAAVALAIGGGLLAVRGARAQPEDGRADDAAILEGFDPEDL